jgi:hypothetical protein
MLTFRQYRDRPVGTASVTLTTKVNVIVELDGHDPSLAAESRRRAPRTSHLCHAAGN